jgi:hypothetical protein
LKAGLVTTLSQIRCTKFKKETAEAFFALAAMHAPVVVLKAANEFDLGK